MRRLRIPEDERATIRIHEDDKAKIDRLCRENGWLTHQVVAEALIALERNLSRSKRRIAA